MMRVGDRDRQRVGGIRASDLHTGKQPRDHGVNLCFLGTAGADDRFLDKARGIFSNLDSCTCGAHQRHAAGLPEFERRLRVLINEDFLDCGGGRSVASKQLLEFTGKERKPQRQGGAAVRPDLSVGYVGETITLSLDQSPAGGAEAGIEPEDFQASFSSSSSGTS